MKKTNVSRVCISHGRREKRAFEFMVKNVKERAHTENLDPSKGNGSYTKMDA
jgi:hypothetical protein